MTDTFDLRIGEMLQGEFEASALNIVLAFQVNCPGCFIHAIPLASSLYETYQHRNVRFLGLSTAFEDFSLNTREHTRQLLEDGKMIGETEKHFSSRGIEKYAHPILFPVAMDAIGKDGVGRTFINNRLPGTPTWIIFDAEYRLQDGWFGHREEQEVIRVIEELLPR